MKKSLMFAMSILLVGFLAACGGSNNNTDDAPTDSEQNEEVQKDKGNDVIDSNKDTDDSDTTNKDDDATNGPSDKDAKMKDLEFAEIELEVEYNNGEQYEAEIEKKSSGEYTSELDDEINNTHLKGDEAFDHIYSLLEKITITKDTSKDEVIDQILQAFELDGDYDEFEVEITFHDGTEMEYEDK